MYMALGLCTLIYRHPWGVTGLLKHVVHNDVKVDKKF